MQEKALAGLLRWFSFEEIPTEYRQLRDSPGSTFAAKQRRRIYTQLLKDFGEAYRSEDVGRIFLRGYLATPKDRWKAQNPGRYPPPARPPLPSMPADSLLSAVLQSPLFDPEPPGDVVTQAELEGEPECLAGRVVYWPQDPVQALRIFTDYLAPLCFLDRLHFEYRRLNNFLSEGSAKKLLSEIKRTTEKAKTLDPDKAAASLKADEAVALWRFENGFYERLRFPFPLTNQAEKVIYAYVGDYLLRPYLKSLYSTASQEDNTAPFVEQSNIPPPSHSFVDLFTNPDLIASSLDALRKIDPPVLSETGNWIGKRGSKSALVAWIKVLEQRGRLKPLPDRATLARLLNQQFPGLNLESTASIFGKETYKRSDYEADLLRLIPA